MAVTNKATLLRIKRMLLSKGNCPWGNNYDFGTAPIYQENKLHLCDSCCKIMGGTCWPDGRLRCPCCYWRARGEDVHKIAWAKIKEAGL